MEYKIALDINDKWRVMRKSVNGKYWYIISPPYTKKSFAIIWAKKKGIKYV